MNTMTAERPPAKAPRMRYPEQALAELKLEDPNTPVTVYMIRRLVAAGTIPSIKMGRRRLQFAICADMCYNSLREEKADRTAAREHSAGA